MSPEIGYLILGLLVLIILTGFPVAISMIGVSLLGLSLMRTPEHAGRFLAAAANDGVNDYVFGVVPLFTLMGVLLSASGIGKDTFDVFDRLIGRLRGGLGLATVASNTVFAAVTGISIASAAVFAKVATPEMIRHGYTPKFSVGVVAGSSVLGMLLPPSLLFIVYGIQAEQSIGRLFLAGIIPALILAIIFSILILGMTWIAPKFIGAGANQRVFIDEREISLPELLQKLVPISLLITLVLGGIYAGVFSPTEAGAVGAFGALVLTQFRSGFTFRQFGRALLDAGNISVSILFLIMAATLYSRTLAFSGLPRELADVLLDTGFGFYGFIAVYILTLIVLGFFLDSVSILLIVVPIVLPVATGLGMDPIWFGVITVIAIEIGLLTPPFGLAVFAVKASLADRSIDTWTIFAGTFPFVIGILLLLLILVVFPGLALLL